MARGRIGSDEREQIHKRASEGMGVREIAEALGRTEDTIRKALGGAAKKSAAPAKRSRSGSARTPRPRKAPAAAPQHVNGETLGDIAKQMMKAGEFERTFTIPVTIRIG